jgi:hypothetical protein
MEHEVDSRVLQLQVFLPAMGTKAIFHGMTAVGGNSFLVGFSCGSWRQLCTAKIENNIASAAMAYRIWKLRCLQTKA